MAIPIPVIPFQPVPAPGVPQVPTGNQSGTQQLPSTGSSSGPGGPSPQIVPNFAIKQKLLRPALTSHFQCWFNPPAAVRGSKAGQYYLNGGETISLLCSEASLPGSSVITNEINDDHTGITERLGYRRQYDDRVDFTFYVDHAVQNGSYNLIMFFEEWIRYAMGESNEISNGGAYNYRVNFPDGDTGYRTEMFISKFERDFAGNYLNYTFVRAYPISIASMPVSYESSQLLKCTVSFTFNRYIVSRKQNSLETEPAPSVNPGFPSEVPPTFQNPQFGVDDVQFGQTGQNLTIEPLYNKNAGTAALF
jgi:hypothetical protein